MSLYYSQSNLIIPELDDDPAILKVNASFATRSIFPLSLQVIHDSERLERETYRRELLKILKIQPTSNGNASSTLVLSEDRRTSNEETIATPPGSQSESDHRASQIWIKRSVPVTPNSNSPRRQHYRSTLHQRSLNSSGESYSNRSLVDSPKSGQHSLMKSARSDTNLSLSPLSMNKTSPIQSHGKTATNTNISVTPSGTIVTDYRQSMTMKRIVNP